MTSTATINAGNIILGYIKTNKISRASLSRKLQISDTFMYKILRQNKMNTLQIESFSHALKHDFFSDFAALLPPEYHKTKKEVPESELRIAQLEQEVQKLTIERDAFLKIIQK